jgi:hypothetical protein
MNPANIKLKGGSAATDTVRCGVATSCRYRIPMCWVLLIVFDFCVMAFALAQDDTSSIPQPPAATIETEITGSDDVAEGTERFEAVDVFLDSGSESLAAWQVELRSTDEDVEIVGIEGGEHSAFADPPYYDPRAMNQRRVILAAFQTGNDLPIGRSRVARIHLLVKGPGSRVWHSEVTTSANAEGRRIPASLTLSRAEE